MPTEKRKIAIRMIRVGKDGVLFSAKGEVRHQVSLFDWVEKSVRDTVKQTYDRAYLQLNAGGSIWQEDDQGNYGGDLLTDKGLVKITQAKLAEDSPVTPERFAASLPSPLPVAAIEHSTKGQWNVLLNATAPIDQRDRALLDLIECGEKSISGFVLTELEKTGLKPEWARRLIVAAEQLDLDDPMLRGRLSKLLIARALSLLSEGQARNDQAIWSALRKFGGLAEPTEVNDLLPFLGVKNTFATRQVALQVIHEIYKQSPPANSKAIDELATRVADIADKFLDPEFARSPENASLALNAFLTLAATGTLNAVKLADRVKVFGSGFILRRSIQALQELVSTWSLMNNQTDDQVAATKNVEAALAGLR